MDELNDIEKGQLVSNTYACFSRAGGSLENLPGLIKKIIRTKAWECRKHPCGRTVYCKSLKDLITKPPLEGWGESIESIEALIKHDAEVLTLFRGEVTAGRGGANNPDGLGGKSGKTDSDIVKGDIVTIDKETPERGNSKAYTASRLSKQNPELFEKVVKGELSANQAAIEAGFRKRTITIPYDPVEAVRALKRKYAKTEWDLFVNEMQSL